MKYLVFSDLHGDYEACKRIIDEFNLNDCDKLICLGDLLYHILYQDTPQPEEPVLKQYYLGGIGNDTKQDVPTWWEDYGFNSTARADHYLEYMKTNDARDYDEATLVSQHELSWNIKTPVGLDEELSEAMGEETYMAETDEIYPAIALPSKYKVTAWSTDAENSYPVADVIYSVETSTGYTIYYVLNAFLYNDRKTFFITIAEK